MRKQKLYRMSSFVSGVALFRFGQALVDSVNEHRAKMKALAAAAKKDPEVG